MGHATALFSEKVVIHVRRALGNVRAMPNMMETFERTTFEVVDLNLASSCVDHTGESF